MDVERLVCYDRYNIIVCLVGYHSLYSLRVEPVDCVLSVYMFYTV